jgi:hypothetical protein
MILCPTVQVHSSKSGPNGGSLPVIENFRFPPFDIFTLVTKPLDNDRP